MTVTESPDRQPASSEPLAPYLATVAVTGSLIGTAAWLAGLADAHRLAPGPATALVVLLFTLFWPCFSLSLARHAERRHRRAFGAPLHALTSLAAMGALFAKPAPLALLPGELPMLMLAMLLAWLAVESGVLRHAEAGARYLWSRLTETTPAGASA